MKVMILAAHDCIGGGKCASDRFQGHGVRIATDNRVGVEGGLTTLTGGGDCLDVFVVVDLRHP